MNGRLEVLRENRGMEGRLKEWREDWRDREKTTEIGDDYRG